MMENSENTCQSPSLNNHFQFETDFIESLRCIPMMVRMKLDTCGVKLKLTHWNEFSQTERQTSIDLPCETPSETEAYREWLQNLVKSKTGSFAKELAIAPNPPWSNSTQIPLEIKEKAREHEVNISLAQWKNLTPAQRFALIKLSRPSHENRNFVPALKEFKIT